MFENSPIGLLAIIATLVCQSAAAANFKITQGSSDYDAALNVVINTQYSLPIFCNTD